MRNWVWVSITCTDGHRQADPKSFLVSQPCGKVNFCFSERPSLKATGRVLPWSPNVCSSAHTHTCKCVHTDRYTTHTTHMLHTEHISERDEVHISVEIVNRLSHWLTNDCVQSLPLRSIYFRIWCDRTPELESQYTQVGLKNHSNPLGSASWMRLQPWATIFECGGQMAA